MAGTSFVPTDSSVSEAEVMRFGKHRAGLNTRAYSSSQKLPKIVFGILKVVRRSSHPMCAYSSGSIEADRSGFQV